MDTRIAAAVTYMTNNGFYFASNSDQEKLANQLVEEGLWQKVKPEWVDDGNCDHFYVLSHVSSRLTMPMSMADKVHSEVYFAQGEICTVELLDPISKISVAVGVKIIRQINDNKYEVCEIFTRSCFLVERHQLMKMF